MDKFFTQTHCDRCGGSLKGGRQMSMFNMDCLCMACIKAERQRSDFSLAQAAERAALLRGERNFEGIGF